jgi:hypothetical protein
MKKVIFLLPVVISSCEFKSPTEKYTYRIEKDSVQRVVRLNDYPLNTRTDTVFVGAVWFTDSITMLGDTASYKNSNGTVVKIAPPFRILRKSQ